jgi:hypothetical protein
MTKKDFFFLGPSLLIFFVVGFFLLRDFPATWDEPRLISYADQSLDAYKSLFGDGDDLYFGEDDLRYYGPAYLTLTQVIVKAISAVFHVSEPLYIWHYINYSVFIFGGMFLYFLSRRWLTMQSSAFVFLLYMTQPLLFGHSFINLKDIPFMVSFLATIYFGLKGFDILHQQGKLESQVGIKPENGLSSIKQELLEGVKTCKTILSEPTTILFGCLLGVTISIRLMGFLAGVIVFLYAYIILQYRKNSIFAFLTYSGFALVISYLTWPYLWSDPFNNFYASYLVMTLHGWPGQVLFDGAIYYPTELPWLYLPTLFLYQLTEPFWLLSVIAVISFIFFPKIREKYEYKSIILLIAIWFLPIFFGVVLGKIRLYDNFRQLLFVLPPMFVLAGFGYEFLSHRLRRSYRIILAILLIFPGVISIVRLHPYQYVYYNSVLGGISNAHQRFETDYWGISVFDAVTYINESAPAWSNVVTYGPTDVVEMYIRPDLKLYEQYEAVDDKTKTTYIVFIVRMGNEKTVFPDVPLAHAVDKDGVPLTMVRMISP